jgi:hypothetical protein
VIALAVTLKENSDVLEQVKSYVKAGGMAIFAASFSSFITPPAINKFWETTWVLVGNLAAIIASMPISTGKKLNQSICSSHTSSLLFRDLPMDIYSFSVLTSLIGTFLSY